MINSIFFTFKKSPWGSFFSHRAHPTIRKPRSAGAHHRSEGLVLPVGLLFGRRDHRLRRGGRARGLRALRGLLLPDDGGVKGMRWRFKKKEDGEIWRACWKIDVFFLNKRNGLTGKWCLILFRICWGWFGLTLESEKSGIWKSMAFKRKRNFKYLQTVGFTNINIHPLSIVWRVYTVWYSMGWCKNRVESVPLNP